MKKLLSLVLLTLIFVSSKADDTNWKQHPIFDEEVAHVIDTPNHVYFTSRTLKQSDTNGLYFSLFKYDKKGDELTPLSTSNLLNSTSIRDVIYNPKKGYLAVLYKDYSMDFLFNDGSVVFMPYYEQANISYPKNVNSMAIDPGSDRLYLATDFGYVSVNDKKNEIAESRIYGEPLMAFCRLGENYIALRGNDLIFAPTTAPRLTLEDYEIVNTFDSPQQLYPVGDNLCLLVTGFGTKKNIKKIESKGGGYEISDLLSIYLYNVEYNSVGLTLTSGGEIYQVSPDGSLTTLERPSGYINSAAASENMSEVWNGLMRKGLSSVKKTGDQWSLTRDWMLPNAPSPFASHFFLNHPSLGLLVLNYGYSPIDSSLPTSVPFQLSSYKQGRWKNHSTAYTLPDRATLLTCTNGMAIDPDNSNYIYISSYRTGFMRLNLSDPNDIIHISHSKDADKGKDGFAELDFLPSKNIGYTNFTAPYFDKGGNLWMAYPDWDNEEGDPTFICWTAADRKASTPSNIRMPQKVTFRTPFESSNLIVSLPLLKTGNGLMVRSAGQGIGERLVMVDSNGTPTDTSDDSVYVFNNITDQDGNVIDFGRIRNFWEDPSTGYVWICHNNGVCYFVPSQVKNGNYQVNRLKVARNDGTNLADYLLDGVMVNNVVADAEGRKWFSTAGAGIVCTTSDGREILEEFNTSNSPLPDDLVYGIGYNEDSNSLIISTDQGFTEYYLPVSQASSTKEDIKAYPNPVRPDYSGYVTITDIPTGSFVKIVDVAGNLIKDLGVMSGFQMLWDISDANFNRVRSGVYHIMISPSDETSSYSTVGKILVMN